MTATVHLHRDYSTAECGLDASHIPMTYDEKAATCAACLKEKPKRVAAEEAEFQRQQDEFLAERAAEKAEEKRLQDERIAWHNARMEIRKAREG